MTQSNGTSALADTPIRFSVFTHIDEKEHLTPTERLREFATEVSLADELGFDYYFTAEHHFSKARGLSTSQGVTAAIIAQNTERIHFGPMTYVLPINDPLRVAEEVVILDHMSNGRYEFGISKGVVPHELITYGVHPSEAPDRFNEALELCLKAWTYEERFSFLGKHHRYFDVEMTRLPLQRPHPRIWVPTATPANALEWGRRGFAVAGFSWLGLELHKEVFGQYEKGFAEAGHDLADLRRAYLAAYVVAPTDEEAAALAARHFPEYVEVFDYEEERSHWFLDTEGKRIFAGLLDLFAKIKTPEYYDEQLIVVHGSPDTVVRKIHQLQDILPVDTLISEFNLGNMPWQDVRRSMELFAEEVMPRFTRAPEAAAAVAAG